MVYLILINFYTYNINCILAVGFTPLHYAAKPNERDMMYSLLGYGADCSAITTEGKSVLDYVYVPAARAIILHQYGPFCFCYLSDRLPSISQQIHAAFQKNNPGINNNNIWNVECNFHLIFGF
jgi:hypothetical protein